jgi:hypothetical protein
MNDAVDRVMASYEGWPALERFGREELRLKLSQYLEKLSSAGHSDAEELTFYGLAYLLPQAQSSSARRHEPEPGRVRRART